MSPRCTPGNRMATSPPSSGSRFSTNAKLPNSVKLRRFMNSYIIWSKRIALFFEFSIVPKYLCTYIESIQTVILSDFEFFQQNALFHVINAHVLRFTGSQNRLAIGRISQRGETSENIENRYFVVNAAVAPGLVFSYLLSLLRAAVTRSASDTPLPKSFRPSMLAT